MFSEKRLFGRNAIYLVEEQAEPYLNFGRKNPIPQQMRNRISKCNYIATSWFGLAHLYGCDNLKLISKMGL